MQDEFDIDEHLDTLDGQEREFTDRCYYRSADRVAGEIRRLARAEHRLIPYMYATFTVMNHAVDLLQPATGRDAAIELIGLLESEDRARSIQADLPEEEYEETVYWLSTCAYDNLAKCTAVLHGFNSDGMHACINDGIQLCRRTGKLDCITCFREYATDVHTSADDLEMAMHYARECIAHDQSSPHDRRWQGAIDVVRLLLLRGQLTEAVTAVDRAWNLTETWHTPCNARLQTRLLMRQLACLLGEPGRWPQAAPAAENQSAANDEPPPGEFAWYELCRDQVDAVADCCDGAYEQAIARLTDWDRRLTRAGCLDDWLRNRLYLLAAHRLAGRTERMDQLAEQLVSKARPARDWLTLRCLEQLRDPASTPAPIPLIADLTAGRFAAPRPAPAPPGGQLGPPIADADDEPEAVPVPADGEPPPQAAASAEPSPEVAALLARLNAILEQDPEQAEEMPGASLEQVLADLLTHAPENVESVDDARWLMHMARFIECDESSGRRVWEWGQALREKFPQDAVLLSLLAVLGATLQWGDEDGRDELVDASRLEAMHRESLELDPYHARNAGRAGDFFQFMENLGEAERCYARGFRLDRQDARIAKQLAGIYRRTEREHEALQVLDMCLREGSDDPELPWSAAVSAHFLGQDEATLTYLREYEERVPQQPWVHYYRAAALLNLGRHDEALAATELEAARNPDCPFHVVVQRAAATAGQGKRDLFRAQLGDVLEMRLADVDYLTPIGLCSLLRVLWEASASVLEEDDPLLAQLSDRAVAANLAPDELFDHHRQAGADEPSDVELYKCLIHQRLDDRWTGWHGRLAHELEWGAYTVTWGVLATSAEEAGRAALAWQERAYPLPATVIAVESGEDSYRDRAGVVWQGYREESSPAIPEVPPQGETGE